MIKIGYQGEIGSNAEAATLEYTKCENINKEEYKLIPLVNSQNVVNSLKTGEIDCGVAAIKNSIAGPVEETINTLKDEKYEVVKRIVLPIHHCIFIKPNINLEQVEFIASHIQALNQTRINRNKLFLNWKEKETRDTALAARELSEGALPDNYAVICRKNAGEYYGLHLVYENIEDDSSNKTEFLIMKV